MAMVPNTQTNNANASLRLANGSGWLDAALLVLALALVAGIAQLGSQMAVSFHPGSDALPGLNLNPALLPYYAARSSLRMFIGLGISLGLCLAIGTLAARNAVAERIIMPIIDVLQSVPVLGFLAITVSFFLHLFQGSLLGLEAASIFAIVTGQVWNLIFSYYQSLRTVPGELNEAARLYRFSGWQRFTRLDLPYGTINLVWNGMMSFAGGWFFATQSEAISVNNSEYTLPGLGSYVATAIAHQRMDCILWALLTMVLVVKLYTLCYNLFDAEHPEASAALSTKFRELRAQRAVKDLPNRRIVTEHEVFDYLARDGGLEIVAVVEEHPGQDPSAAGMVRLISTPPWSRSSPAFPRFARNRIWRVWSMRWQNWLRPSARSSSPAAG
jgi:ABC-type nitrate/sulfonate/bicarbonate transport system permease component